MATASARHIVSRPSPRAGPPGLGALLSGVAPVSAVARNPNALDLFITGNDGRVYASAWEAGCDWSGIERGWSAIGGLFPPGSPVSAVARHPERLDLFVTGANGRVYTSSWEGSPRARLWGGWTSIGGRFPAGAPIGAVARAAGRMDLFATGSDGLVYTSAWSADSPWSDAETSWTAIGGFFSAGAPVTAVAPTPHRIELYITGQDGRVFTSSWQEGSRWSGRKDDWSAVGGGFFAGSPVSVVVRPTGRADLFVSGFDGTFHGLGNGEWQRVRESVPWRAPLSAVAQPASEFELFVSGNDGVVFSQWRRGRRL